MLDLVIKGGTVVTPSGVGHCDVGVQGERIVALGLPGKLREEAEKTIDASGKIVIPGGIEAHTHVGFPHLVSLWGEVTSGPEELSKAALWGGTTTMLDFANVTIADTADLVAAVHEHLSHFSGRMYVDYSVHASFLGSSTTPGKIAQIRDLVAAGFPSVKVYTTNHAPRPNRPLTRINTGQLVAIMEQAAEHGAVVAVHAEEDEIVQWNYEEAKRNQQWDWHYLPRIRSNLSEELAVRQCIRIAEFTGAAIYVVHTSAKEGVDAIAESRSRGYPIDGETILLYCCFNSQKYEEKDGMKYHTYPSTKSEKDRLQLWDGLFRGNLNIAFVRFLHCLEHVGVTGLGKVRAKIFGVCGAGIFG